MKIAFRIHTVILFLLGSIQILAQNQVSQKDVDIETDFIEAKKYILIDRGDKAEKILKRLHSNDRSNPVIAYELSNAYVNRNQLDQGLRYLTLATQNDQNNTDYLNKAAELCTQLEKHGEAGDYYKKLVQLNPKNMSYTDQLARNYVHIGKPQMAIKAYQKIESLVGITEESVNKKVTIWDNISSPEKSIQAMEELLTIQPQNTDIMNALALRYIQQGDRGKARTMYSKVLTIDKDNATAHMALAGNPVNPSSDSGYLKGLRPVIENTNIPLSKKATELTEHLEKWKQNNDPALLDALANLAERLKNTHPQEAKSYAMYGDVLMAQKKYDDASTAYKKSLDIDDRSYAAWYQLMTAYYKNGQLDALKSQATEAIDFFPNKATAYLMLARAQRGTTQAYDALEEALLIAGGNASVTSTILTEKAINLLQENKEAEAKKILQEAITLDGTNMEAQDLLKK